MYHLDISDVSFSMLVFVFSFDMIVLEENIKSSVMPTFLTLLKIKITSSYFIQNHWYASGKN